MSDVEIQASPHGTGQVVVDGADLTEYVHALGVDLVAGDHTRVVLEGKPSLRVFLESVEIEYRQVPTLTEREFRVLEKGRHAFDQDSEARDRFDRVVGKLEEIARIGE